MGSIKTKNSSAMNTAGALCGCAALFYLFSRLLLTFAASQIIAAKVPGASLSNPAGVEPAQVALLKLIVNTLALSAPFLLLCIRPLPRAAAFKKFSWALVCKLFLFFWGSMFFGNTLASLLSRFEGSNASRIHLPPSGLALVLAYCAVCLLPAIGEELLFRGLLQGWLLPFGALPAILGQAILFSLLHGRVSACIAALFGGFALGYCAFRTHSLLPGILFHLYNNNLAFISQYASQFWDPAIEQFIKLVLLFAPLFLLFVPSMHKKQAPVHLPTQFWGWIFRCPGWLCSVSVLAVFCLIETYL